MSRRSDPANAASGGFVLSLAGEFTPAGSATIDDNDLEHRVYRKELIRIGDFVQGGVGEEFHFGVTSEALDNWVAMFAEMKANGVKVPVPIGHWVDAETNRGFVLDIYRDGDSLYGTIELIGEGIALASTNDVSIFSPPDFVDGAGNRYTRPILHVALTPEPVIPGQAGFEVIDKVTIAASNAGASAREWKKVPVLRLAAATGADPMIRKIAEALGVEITDEMTDEQIAEAVLAKAEGMKEKDAGMDQAVDQAVEAAIAAERAKQGPKPKAIDPITLKMSRKAYRAELDALVVAGNITPAVRDRLAKTLIDDAKALSLSLTTDAGASIDAVIAALKDNDPIKLGEQTVIAASRNTPGGEGSSYDPELVKRMAGHVGVKQTA